MTQETSIKRPKKPFKGAVDGKPFSADNQPSSDTKKAGWEELRKRKLLTRNILKILFDAEGIPLKDGEDYFKSLVTNAKGGNAKAIDTVNKAIENELPTSIELNGKIETMPDESLQLEIARLSKLINGSK